jgi:deoxyinosine 3'endonuclease (endonuclease V)
MEKTDTHSNDLNESFNEELIAKWRSEQIELKKRLITHDTEPWQINRSVFSSSSLLTTEFASNQSIRYVAGLDISFVKSKDTACTGLFVFDITNNMELVYKDMSIIEMDQPYISGYLAYREAPFLLE